MHKIGRFFTNFIWNSAENRLRLTWRLSGQILILLVLLIGFFLLFNGIRTPDPVAQGDFLTILVDSDSASAQPQSLLAAVLVSGSALTISIWLASRLLDRRSFRSFGFCITKEWWVDFGFGFGLGAVLMSLIFLVELTAGWIKIDDYFFTKDPEMTFITSLGYPFVTFLVIGFYEELFSRGYQLKNLAEGFSGKFFNPRAAIILATILTSGGFGLLHVLNPHSSLSSLLNTILAGIFLATGYILTGQLAIPIALHISWNFFQGCVFGFPVSGGIFQSATFILIKQSGPDLWTGGQYGPEAGLLATISMLIGILMISLWVKNRSGKIDFHLPLIKAPVNSIE